MDFNENQHFLKWFHSLLRSNSTQNKRWYSEKVNESNEMWKWITSNGISFSDMICMSTFYKKEIEPFTCTTGWHTKALCNMSKNQHHRTLFKP